jgi:hypothetical protein
MNEKGSRKEADLLAKVEDALAGNGFITEGDSTYLLLPTGTRLTARFKKIPHRKYRLYLYRLLVSKNGDPEPAFVLNVKSSSFEHQLAAQIKRFSARERREARRKKKERRATADKKILRTSAPEESLATTLSGSKNFHFLCSACHNVKLCSEMVTDGLCEACSYDKELT